jgi:hypothetical protein
VLGGDTLPIASVTIDDRRGGQPHHRRRQFGGSQAGGQGEQAQAADKATPLL